MSVHSLLQQMQHLESLAKSQPVKVEAGQDKPSFTDMMQQAIDQVNQSQMNAAEMGKALEMGDPSVDIAEVMVAVQKSRVAFEALTEVRNKLLTAYQDVMNMPV